MWDNDINEVLHRIDKNVRSLRAKVELLLDEEDRMADALQEAFNGLAAQVASVEGVDSDVEAELQSLASQIQNIKPDTTLTADQITGLATSLTSTTEKLKQANTAAQAPASPAAPAEPPATAPAGTDTTLGVPAQPDPASVAAAQTTSTLSGGVEVAPAGSQPAADAAPADQPAADAGAAPAAIPATDAAPPATAAPAEQPAAPADAGAAPAA